MVRVWTVLVSAVIAYIGSSWKDDNEEEAELLVSPSIETV